MRRRKKRGLKEWLSPRLKDWSAGSRSKMSNNLRENCFVGKRNLAPRNTDKTCQESGNPRFVQRKLPPCARENVSYSSTGSPGRWGPQPRQYCGSEKQQMEGGKMALSGVFSLILVFP